MGFKIFIISIGAILLLIFLFFVIKYSLHHQSELEIFKSKIKELGYKEVPSGNKMYDSELVKGDKKFLVKYLSSPKYAEISINNPSLIEIKYGGTNDPGKPAPFHKFINNFSDFMHMETEYTKVIVIYPPAKKIVKWINENEMIIVKYDTNVYGNHFISCNDYKLFE